VTLVWHHSVRFPYETGLDLNDNQPNIIQMGSNPDFTVGSNSNDTPGFTFYRKAGTVAKADPTFRDCMDSFVTQAQDPGGDFNIRVGESACFESQDGTRVAAVTALSWDKQTWAMYADVTVWQTASP
jgi:hypothetical protein